MVNLTSIVHFSEHGPVKNHELCRIFKEMLDKCSSFPYDENRDSQQISDKIRKVDCHKLEV